MPSFKKISKKGQEKWTVIFDIKSPDGNKRIQKRLRGYSSRRDAELAYISYSNNDGVIYIPEKTKIISEKQNISKVIFLKFSDIYENYIEYKALQTKGSSIVDSQTCFNKFILPYFAEKDINSITPAEIINWQMTISKPYVTYNKSKRIEKSLSTAYKNKIYGYLKNFYNYAFIYHDITSNPCLKVQNFRKIGKKKEMLIWAPADFEKFIQCVDNKIFNAYFNLLYYSGLRPGEGIALKWDDLNNNIIRVDETITRKLTKEERKTGMTWKLTSTKNTSSERNVDLPEKVAKQLINLKQSQVEYSEQNFIFGGLLPIADSSINRHKEKACKHSGVTKIRNHDFRHSHASLLISMGFDIVSIAKRLGHSDIKQTLNTYGHIMPNMQSEMAKKLNNI